MDVAFYQELLFDLASMGSRARSRLVHLQYDSFCTTCLTAAAQAADESTQRNTQYTPSRYQGDLNMPGQTLEHMMNLLNCYSSCCEDISDSLLLYV